ncbi:hypothetical protein [Deinococcus sp.]|uniref:hypothetical protein n=1 Tax=Deinococcus sp. TaxID=47478 RepID=UPI0025F1192F|nr:hypothetical protein [Deinococcus sp.]
MTRSTSPGAGQTLTRSLLLFILLLGAVPTLARWVQGDFARWLQSALFLLATAWLLWNVDKGSVLAWRVVSSMSIVLGILAMLLGLVIGQGAVIWWLVAVVGVLFVTAGLLLVGLPDVRAYLDTRWASWRRGKPRS